MGSGSGRRRVLDLRRGAAFRTRSAANRPEAVEFHVGRYIALSNWLIAVQVGADVFLVGVGKNRDDGGVGADLTAWLSMDNTMCCGVGACLTCVQKVVPKDGAEWTWARVCTEGPVFESREIVWE